MVSKCLILVLSSMIFAVGAIDAIDGTTIEGRVIVHDAFDSSDAVVYIDKIPGQHFTPPTTQPVLDQVNLRFTPHVLPVLVGTTVAFPNSDAVRHNVFSPTANSQFTLGTYPRGSVKYRVFDKPGAITLLCNVHAEMSGYVVVIETPYFAVAGKSGEFVIRGVPPGKYVLKTWHPKARPSSMDIEVAAGGIRNLTVELKK